MTTNEIWIGIKQLDGLYEISNIGNIKSVSRRTNSSVQSKGYRIIKEKLNQWQD